MALSLWRIEKELWRDGLIGASAMIEIRMLATAGRIDRAQNAGSLIRMDQWRMRLGSGISA